VLTDLYDILVATVDDLCEKHKICSHCGTILTRVSPEEQNSPFTLAKCFCCGHKLIVAFEQNTEDEKEGIRIEPSLTKIRRKHEGVGVGVFYEDWVCFKCGKLFCSVPGVSKRSIVYCPSCNSLAPFVQTLNRVLIK
jgi:DNA-directed RNA polymerase subunit RPC12/RpoP